MTRQRREILRELKAVKDHPTADTLYARLRGKLPRISLATVYRNLELLSEQGLIRTLEFPGMPRRYDGDTSSHYHIRCIECNKVVDVELDHIPDLGSVLHKLGDFQVLAMRLEFDGVCEDCRKRASDVNV